MNTRVKLIRKQLGMTQEQLAQHLGIGKAALSMIETGKAGLSARNRNILVQELNVNPEWLESGKGNMFNAEPDLTAYRLRTDNSLPLQSVPLYSIEGTAGLVPLFTDQAQAKPVNFIHIPNLPKCDGAIYIVGDSMYPLLKSGDIVLYKQLGNIDDIFWGDMYLLSIDIDGEEYVTVKYIQKSDREGYVKLVSQNPHHADKEVALSRIRAIALVKASIRMIAAARRPAPKARKNSRRKNPRGEAFVWVGPGKDRARIREESRQIREKPGRDPKRPETKIRNGNDEEMRKHRKKGSETAAGKQDKTEQNKQSNTSRKDRNGPAEATI